MKDSRRNQRINKLASLGCIVCRNIHGVFSHAELHHVRRLATSKKRDKAPILPLCALHHRGPYGIGVHSGRETWEKNYGGEVELLDQVDNLIKEPR